MLHSRHPLPGSNAPLANDRAPRPDAPRARRLRRRDVDIRARGHTHSDADTYPNAYACANRNPYCNGDRYTNAYPNSYACANA